MPEEKKYSRTDDDRAREAAENPLGTASRPGPTPGLRNISWKWPALAVAIAVIALFVYSTVIS